MSFSDKKYWATKTGDEYLQELHKRIEDYYNDLESTKLFYLWEKSFMAYYGANLTGDSGQLFDSSELKRSGQKNEVVNFKINHYRNLLQHTLQLVIADRPAWTCRSANTDYKSQAQCILGKGLLDYYYREKNFQKDYKQIVENALVFSEGWVHAPWNETAGELIGVDNEAGQEIFEGDFDFTSHTPLDIVRDIGLQNNENHDWLIVRNFDNKYDLAAKYKPFEQDILNTDEQEEKSYEQFSSFNLRIRNGGTAESDRIPKWILYHMPTESLPNGRMTIFTSNSILFDGEIPYKRIPVYAVFPENLIMTPYGYSPAFDILGPQQGLDILNSSLMTNNASNAIQNIWTKRGDDLNVKDLGGGMKHLSSESKPESVQLTKSAPETFNFRQQIIGEMETLVGISATVRGNPEASLKSGAALALVVTQSIQFASILEQSVNTMLEEFGTGLIENLKVFAKSNRVATIMGESSRPYQKQFSGEDLQSVNRVIVDRVSPISKTTAGRLQIADNLLERGLIDNPKKYVQLLTTGSLDVVTDDIQNAMLNIQADMESLRRGEPVQAVIIENHPDCIKAATGLINPDSKKDPEFVALVLKYIQDHLNLWRQMSPDLAAMTGNPPPPPQTQAPQMSQPAPVPGQPTNTPDIIQENRIFSSSELPNNPNMPNLPGNAPEEAQAAYDKLNNKL